jgi:hypothetical protein
MSKILQLNPLIPDEVIPDDDLPGGKGIAQG